MVTNHNPFHRSPKRIKWKVTPTAYGQSAFECDIEGYDDNIVIGAIQAINSSQQAREPTPPPVVAITESPKPLKWLKNYGIPAANLVMKLAQFVAAGEMGKIVKQTMEFPNLFTG